MDSLTTSQLVLDIAGNLARISRYAMEKRPEMIQHFLNEVLTCYDVLQTRERHPKFEETNKVFGTVLTQLKNGNYDYDWADLALTYSSILTHRAVFLVEK